MWRARRRKEAGRAPLLRPDWRTDLAKGPHIARSAACHSSPLSLNTRHDIMLPRRHVFSDVGAQGPPPHPSHGRSCAEQRPRAAVVCRMVVRTTITLSLNDGGTGGHHKDGAGGVGISPPDGAGTEARDTHRRPFGGERRRGGGERRRDGSSQSLRSVFVAPARCAPRPSVETLEKTETLEEGAETGATEAPACPAGSGGKSGPASHAGSVPAPDGAPPLHSVIAVGPSSLPHHDDRYSDVAMMAGASPCWHRARKVHVLRCWGRRPVEDGRIRRVGHSLRIR